jgi:hypothetical protein
VVRSSGLSAVAATPGRGLSIWLSTALSGHSPSGGRSGSLCLGCSGGQLASPPASRLVSTLRPGLSSGRPSRFPAPRESWP